jgi:hypothetical protein
MADEGIQVLIGGENSGALESMAQVRYALQGLTAPLRGVRDNLGELAEAFIAAFAVEKIAHFVDQITEMGAAVEHATHELGMSAEQVSTLNVAFEAMGLGQEGASRGLERLAYNMNQAAISASGPAAHAFQALGISMDELKSMSLDQVMARLADVFSRTADGPNKTAIAIALLGRSGAAMIPILDQGQAGLERFRQIAQETGTIITGPMAEGMEQTAIATATLGDATEGVGITLYEAFKPAIDAVVSGLTSLIEGFNNSLKAGGNLNTTLETIVIAVDLVVAVVETFVNGLRQLWDVGETVLRDLGQAWSTLGTVMKDVVTFDFADVKSDFAAGWANMAQVTLTGLQHIKDIGQKEIDDIKQLFSNIGLGVDTSGGAGGARSGGSKPQLPSLGGNEQKDQQQSLIQQWREQLQQRQIDEQNFFKSSQAEELAYWQGKLATVKEYEEQYGLTEKQAAALHLQVQTQIYNLDKEQASEWLAAYRAGLTEQQDALKEELANKEIGEGAYYQRSLQLATNWQQLMAQIYGKDSAEYQKALQQKDQLDRQHAAQEQQVWQKAATTISNAFDTMLRGVLQGTQTWQQAIERLVGNLVLTMIENFAKSTIQWAAQKAEQLLLEQATDTAIVASHTAANAANTASDAAVNIGPSVLKHAGSAAAAVYDDVSQIPYVGWVLAPPAAAAAFAAVAAFASFDVGAWNLPSDMIAQVHQGEMILPADVAGQVRGGGSIASFASGAGSAGGGGGVQVVQNLTISTMDGASVTAHAQRFAPVYARAVVQQLERSPSARGKF